MQSSPEPFQQIHLIARLSCYNSEKYPVKNSLIENMSVPNDSLKMLSENNESISMSYPGLMTHTL